MTTRDPGLGTRGSGFGISWRVAATFAAAFWLCSVVSAFAHDPGLSSLTIVVAQGQVSATLSLSPADAKLLTGDRAAGLDALALEAIDLRAGGGRLTGRVTSRTAGDADVSVQVTFERAPGLRLGVRSAIPAWMPRGHRELLRVYGPDGVLLAERMLDGGSGEVGIDLKLHGGETGVGAASSFFRLGLMHILEGYDHLLFLCALLLAARGLKDVARTTTAFTVGHSVTLALAALGVVTIPSGIVEPVIALSIVWAGVESLRPSLRQEASAGRREGSRWVLAGLFGLVHGFGFAGALRDLGIGTWSTAIAIPLGSFNAGVEAGQIAVAALVWPAFRHLHVRRPALRLYVAPACSVLIVIAGAYWFAERTFR